MLTNGIFAGKNRITVAIAQASPVFLDKQKTIEKATELIEKTGRKGADLIVFPESFIPAFPYWQQGYNDPSSEWFNVHVEFQDQSVLVGSEDTDLLSQAARQAGIHLVMGCTELDNAVGSRTLYNTMLYFDRNGHLYGKHRKVIPTNQERCFHGMGGGGENLRVYDTDIGRMGGLVCWENHMILIRALMALQGEEIHIANWPGTWSGMPTEDMTYVDRESKNPQSYNTSDIEPAIRAHAFEAQTFVISACGYQPVNEVPNDFPYKQRTNWDWANGGSSIVDPFGCYVVEPVYDKEELIIAELDGDMIKAAKNGFDLLGHYSRPDLVQLIYNDAEYRHLIPKNLLTKKTVSKDETITLQEIRNQLSQLETRLVEDKR